MIQIIKDYCPQNHPCPVLSVCPVNAIVQEHFHTHPVIDNNLCIECGECTQTCCAFQYKEVI